MSYVNDDHSLLFKMSSPKLHNAPLIITELANFWLEAISTVVCVLLSGKYVLVLFNSFGSTVKFW